MAYDVCIIGAGLVGLGVARALSESHPGIGIVIVDKEETVAAHQSSHNSGVVHSGLYYRPGSLKAQLCVEGRRRLKDYCSVNGIGFEESGKLVIATTPSELEPLAELERRGRANGLSGLTRVDSDGIRGLEPAAVGLEALHVPEAGVVDFPAVAAQVARDLTEGGAEIRTGFEVETIDHHDDGAHIRSADNEIRAGVVVNCAGLHSDRVAALAGVRSQVRIVPFRGEYYTLEPEAKHLVRALIYPVPDPRFPFLGVHFTRRIDGSVEVGPNAVLAIGREHYRDADPDWAELRRDHRGPRFSSFGHEALAHRRHGDDQIPLAGPLRQIGSSPRARDPTRASRPWRGRNQGPGRLHGWCVVGRFRYRRGRLDGPRTQCAVARGDRQHGDRVICRRHRGPTSGQVGP